MPNPYEGREQTQAKHGILKRYLQALVFKLMEIGQQELTYVDGFSYVKREIEYAKGWLIKTLNQSSEPFQFGDLCLLILEIFRLRETNVKDICVDLGRLGVIREPWRQGGPRHKPRDSDLIQLKGGDSSENDRNR